MAVRAYRLNKRAESMAETRRRILEAARALFLGGDFHEVSMDEVARQAGVGRTTVFQQFESKTGLLRGLHQEVSARAGVEELLKRLGVDDAAGALRAAFVVGCRVWEAERAMFRKLFSLAVLDPEMGAVMGEQEQIRRQLVERLVKALQREGRLRPGVSARKAADLMWLLTGFDSFDSLHGRCGSADKVSALLLELAGGFLQLEGAGA